MVPLKLLTILFEVTNEIRNLPVFHSYLWSSLFRNGYLRFLEPDEEFGELGLRFYSPDNGITSYEISDLVEIAVVLPAQEEKRFGQVLSALTKTDTLHGYFLPGRNLQFLGANCRLSDKLWKKENAVILDESVLAPAITKLCSLEHFSLQFLSPLRLKLPQKNKSKSRRYCNSWYFFNSKNSFEPIVDYARQLYLDFEEAENFNIEFELKNQTMDISFPNCNHKKGVLGKLKVKCKLDSLSSKALIMGIIGGIGKNTTMGFGRYMIPEIQHYLPYIPLKRNQTMFGKIFTVENMGNTLKNMKNSSPGPDGITADILRKGGKQTLIHLRNSLISNSYKPGGTIKYEIPKADGEFREIHIGNAVDRLLQKTVQNKLANLLDPLFSKSNYAFRKGRGTKSAIRRLKDLFSKGFVYGIKFDIESFFDSVDLKSLESFLQSLFPEEPLNKLLVEWLIEGNPQKKTGLPQGNPISPLFANLYLNGFDYTIEKHPDLHLIRYSDDMIICCNQHETIKFAKKTAINLLNKLGLSIKKEKFLEFGPTSTFSFLGYQIDNKNIEFPKHKYKKKQEEESEENPRWRNLFDNNWSKGKSVYVTSQIYKVSTSTVDLILTNSNNRTRRIPWSSIGRICVIGRQRLTGEVFTKALYKNIPITFQSLMGEPYGHLASDREVYRSSLRSTQIKKFSDKKYCLRMAKTIINAKIKNRGVLIKRKSNKYPDYLFPALDRLKKCKDLEELRGVEGSTAKNFYQEFGKYTAPFDFSNRVYRPPDNPVNAMLSLGYTLLYHRLNSSLLNCGLDTRIAFFHTPRGRHAVLASDLMEEVRFLVDRVVLSLITLKMINPDMFEKSKGDGPINRLGDEAFKIYIKRFENAMDKRFTSTATGQKISYNEYLDEMAEKMVLALKLQIPYSPQYIR